MSCDNLETEVVTGRDPVDQIAEEFFQRRAAGEFPTVDEYCGKYPDLAARINELLPTMLLLDGLRLINDVAPSSQVGQRIGDFRIIREVGRGGMGIIYEAVQESLARRVALKVLYGPTATDPAARERFLREAQTAAKLHHSHIVPVYFVGEQDGVPYFAMQFIVGQSLGEKLWLRSERESRATRVRFDAATPQTAAGGAFVDRPANSASTTLPLVNLDLDYRVIVAWMAQAAEALDYAHLQGVVHRDIKPANLMLQDEDWLWITDFGLAKAADAGDLTSPGVVVGTLRYVPPEAFLGETGAAGDIYSLGATFYEVLAGRPAFEASRPEGVIDLIRRGDIVALRKLNRAVPRDLETIVLKCLAHDPTKRYARAGAVADDLRRYLAGMPIRARRVGPIERFIRWARRNPVIAGSIVTVFLSLSLGLLVSIAYARAAHRAHVFTLETLDKMISEDTVKLLKERRQLTDDQKDFLSNAKTIYQELANKPANDDASRLQRARTYEKLAFLHMALGEEALAEQADQLAAGQLSPTLIEHRCELAARHVRAAIRFEGLRQVSDACRHYRVAIDIQKSIVIQCPDVADFRHKLYRTYSRLSSLLLLSRDYVAHTQNAREKLKLCRELAAGSPERLDLQWELAMALGGLGNHLSPDGRTQEGEDALKEAVSILQGPAGQQRVELALALSGYGNILVARNKWPEAQTAYREAAAIYAAFSTQAPDNPHHAIDRIAALYRAGDFPLNISREILERDLEPNSPAQVIYSAASRTALVARALELHGDQSRAEAHAVRAVELLKLAVENGFDDFNHLATTDFDIEGLRGRTDFQAVVRLLDQQK